jgi:hypothetical protein
VRARARRTVGRRPSSRIRDGAGRRRAPARAAAWHAPITPAPGRRAAPGRSRRRAPSGHARAATVDEASQSGRSARGPGRRTRRRARAPGMHGRAGPGAKPRERVGGRRSARRRRGSGEAVGEGDVDTSRRAGPVAKQRHGPASAHFRKSGTSRSSSSNCT